MDISRYQVHLLFLLIIQIFFHGPLLGMEKQSNAAQGNQETASQASNKLPISRLSQQINGNKRESFNCTQAKCINNEGRGYKSIKELNRHILIVHKICPLCNFQPDSIKQLCEHVQEKHSNELECFSCDICGTSITTYKNSYLKHIEDCKFKAKYKINTPERKKSVPKRKENTPKAPLNLKCFIKNCTRNEKDFSTQCALNDHILNQHQSCPFCKDEKLYTLAESLQLHISSEHVDIKSHLCELCNKYLTTKKSTYKQHKDSCKKKTPKAPLDLKCFVQNCTKKEKIFSAQSALNDHILNQHQCCPFCKDEKLYTSPESLQLHISNEHVDIKSHLCEHCNKYLTTKKGTYNQHKDLCKKKTPRVPLDLKCFVQNYTKKEKIFSSKYTLDHHILNRHRCCPCCKDEKIYTSPESLQLHISSEHIDTKSYLCELCKKYVTTQKNKNNLHKDSCKKKMLLRGNPGDNESLKSTHVIDSKPSLNTPELKKSPAQTNILESLPKEPAIAINNSSLDETKVDQIEFEAIAQKNNTILADFETQNDEQASQELDNQEIDSGDKIYEQEDCLSSDDRTVQLLPKVLPHQGIQNESGTDCFINASFQVLGNIPEFETALHEKEYPENSVSGKLITFLNRLRTEENVLSGSKDLRNYIIDNTNLEDLKNMGIGQHDAQEFLSQLLELFKDELKPVFEMEHESSVTCTTGCYNNQTIDLSWLLSLQMPSQRDPIELQTLINNFFNNAEKINDFSCIQCRQRGGQRTIALKTLPPVLVIAPKRFEYDQEEKQSRRINTPISTQETITLCDEKNEMTYQLIGVIAHTGTLSGGHYIAHIKDSSDNRWYKYDDSVRTKTSAHTATQVSESPYIYFYRCINKQNKAPIVPEEIIRVNPQELANNIIQDISETPISKDKAQKKLKKTTTNKKKTKLKKQVSNKKQSAKNKQAPRTKKDTTKSLPKRSSTKRDKIRVFKTKPALDNHLLKIHISCPLCTTKISYESHEKLCNHVIAEHRGQSFYYCKSCKNFTTTELRLYEKHQQDCDQEKNSKKEEKSHFNCHVTECNNNNEKGFGDRKSFDNHMVFEHNICHLCEGTPKLKQFKSTLNLFNHIKKKHPQTEYYYCDKCKAFITLFYAGYRTHALECLDKNEPPLLLHCPRDDCNNNLGKSFLTEASLNNHLLTIHKICHWCSEQKQYETSAKLYEHIITAHQHVHCYYCDICQTTELTDAELHKIHCTISARTQAADKHEDRQPNSPEARNPELSTPHTKDEGEQDCIYLKTQSSEHQDSSEIFECRWCTLAPFNSQEKFLEHVRAKHPGCELYYCQDCECTVTSFDEYLKRHDYNAEDDNHAPTTLSAMKCRAEYKPDKQSINKIQDKIDNKTCHFCNKIFTQKNDLIAHYWDFHDKIWVHSCTCNFLTLEAKVFHRHKQTGCKPYVFNKPKCLKIKKAPQKIKPLLNQKKSPSNKKHTQKSSPDNNEKINDHIPSSQDYKIKTGRHYSCDWCEEYTTNDFTKYEKHRKKCSHDDIAFSLNDSTQKRKPGKSHIVKPRKKRKILHDKVDQPDTLNEEEDDVITNCCNSHVEDNDSLQEPQASSSLSHASFFDEPGLIDKRSQTIVDYSHEDSLPILRHETTTSLPPVISNNDNSDTKADSLFSAIQAPTLQEYVSFFDEPGMVDEQNKNFVNYAPDEENQNLEQPTNENYRCGQFPKCTRIFKTALELVEHYKQEHLDYDGESDEEDTPHAEHPLKNQITLDKCCLDCPMQCATHTELTQHYANEHNKWVYDCACGFFAFILTDLTTHQQTDCTLHQAPIHSCVNSKLLIDQEPLNEIEKVETNTQNTVDIINRALSPEVITQEIQEINQKLNNESLSKKDVFRKTRTQKRKRSAKAQTSRPLKKRKISQNKLAPVIPEKRADANLAILADTVLFDELRTVALEYEAACKDADTLQQTQQSLLSLARTALEIDASKRASKNILSLINAASNRENTTQDKELVSNNNQESSQTINENLKMLPHQQPVHFIQIEVLHQTTYEKPANRSADVHKLLKDQSNLCALFARFNVEFLMEELRNNTYNSIDLSRHDVLDRFTQKLCNAQNFDAWIEKHKNALTSIKQSNKNSLGMLNNLQIQKIPESENFLIIEFDELKDDLKIFREHMIIDAIHRFRDTHNPQGILINIQRHWIVLVITELQTWIMDSLGTAHVDDQGHIKDESIALIDRRFRSDYFPAWKDYMQVRSEFRKAKTADELTHAYAQAHSIKLPLKVIESLLDNDGWCPYRKELSQKDKQSTNIINLDDILDNNNSHTLESYQESGKKRKHNPLAQETPQNKKHKADEELAAQTIHNQVIPDHKSTQQSPGTQPSSNTIPEITTDDMDSESDFLENLIAEKSNDTPSDNLETLIYESVSHPKMMNDEQPSTSTDNLDPETHLCQATQSSSSTPVANSPEDDHLYNEILNDYLTQSPEKVITQEQTELKTCPPPENQSVAPINSQPAELQKSMTNELPMAQDDDFRDIFGDFDNILDLVETSFGFENPETSLVSLAPKSGPNAGISNETGANQYLNAMLQILSNIPALEKIFTQNKYDKNSTTGKLIEFLNKLRTEENPVSGSGLLYKNFLGMFKIDSNKRNNPVRVVHDFIYQINKEIYNIFATEIIQTRICKNNHLISRLSGLIHYLPIYLSDNMNNTNISSALSKNMNLLTNNSSCPECNTNIIGNNITIQKYPEVLALGINRWRNINNTVQRYSTMVNHNEKIILNNTNDTYSYELMGMILELGDYNEQRYVSCIKDSLDNKWYLYDDTVRTALLPQMLTQASNTTSMLFYQRITDSADITTSKPLNNQNAPNQRLQNKNFVQHNIIQIPGGKTSNVLQVNPQQKPTKTSLKMPQSNPENSLLSLAAKSNPNMGIINESGSDCFMSATLQVLSNIKALNELLTKNKYNPDSVIETLKSFFDTLRSEQNPVSGAAQLRHNLVNYMSQYTGHRNMATGQHDAHELITTLLASLNHEIKNIFSTELVYNQVCLSCKNSLTNSSLESSLSLELKDQLTPITVYALLNNFLNYNEQLKDYRCERCNTIGNVNRKTLIKKLPEVFILTAKRFSFENNLAQRINTPIIPQKEIQLNYNTYQLMGIILQEGTLLHGHYTAYVKDRLDEQWYYYDDQGRKECALEEIKSNSAYIFFYQRVKSSPQAIFNQNSVIKYTQGDRSDRINNNNIINNDLINHSEQTITEKNSLDILQPSHENFLLSLTPRSNPNAGIINENGTDCFMTATLQILSNIPAIEKTLIKNSYSSNSIMGTLIAFFNTLRTEKNALPQSTLLRNYLVNTFGDQRMAIGQHDARHFVAKLLHVLDPEIKKKFNIEINIDQMCESKKHSSTYSIVERELPLDIPDQPEQVSIKTVLNDLLTKGQYFEFCECKECNDRIGLHRKISIKKLPQILTLSVKRFKQENNVVKRKNTPISAARRISLSDDDGEHTYELVGIILQTGPLYKGRYMACVKDHNNQKWHKYDDDIRTTTSINDVLAISSDHFYMLFYQQIN